MYESYCPGVACWTICDVDLRKHDKVNNSINHDNPPTWGGEEVTTRVMPQSTREYYSKVVCQ
jgi:hypothetical protein